MRFILLSLLVIAFPCTLISQLEFVGTYDSVARLIYLSDNEPAIFIYNQENEHIELYDTDLSLISTFDIPIEYEGTAQYNLFHVSKTLFDCDSTNIEYLISYSSENISEAYIKILREDGSVLLNLPEHTFADEGMINVVPSIHKAMIEDENGVLFMFFNSGLPHPSEPTTLYRSCGSIPGCSNPCDETTVGVMEQVVENSQIHIYPNPGNGQFSLEYDLPREFSRATLLLFDMRGKEVLRKTVGPSMSHVLINTSSLSSGRYEVVLSTKEGMVISASYIEL
jgi:hypothetical protein